MKRQIRRGIFETNSSSTHAICITQKDVDIRGLPTHITFTHGDFGWAFDIHKDTRTKASYLYQAICDLYYKDNEAKDEKINTIASLLREYNIECEFEPDEDKEYGDGYIDHVDETVDFVNTVLSDSDELIRYLFGDSFLVIGNDNWDDYDDYMSSHNFLEYEIYEKGN